MVVTRLNGPNIRRELTPKVWSTVFPSLTMVGFRSTPLIFDILHDLSLQRTQNYEPCICPLFGLKAGYFGGLREAM